MFRTVIVPLDGSEVAERALPLAVRLANANHGRVVLIRAAMAAPPATLDGAGWEADQVAAIQEAEAYLQGVAQTIARVPVEIAAPYGRGAAAILEAVSEYAADGVVMSTHGR